MTHQADGCFTICKVLLSLLIYPMALLHNSEPEINDDGDNIYNNYNKSFLPGRISDKALLDMWSSALSTIPSPWM